MPKLLTQGVSLEPKNGRQLIGIVAGFKSERWPVIDRNAGRLQLGIRSHDFLPRAKALSARSAALFVRQIEPHRIYRRPQLVRSRVYDKQE